MPRLGLTLAGKLEPRWNTASCSKGHPTRCQLMYQCYYCGSIQLFQCNMAASHVSLPHSHASYLSANQFPGMTAKVFQLVSQP